MNTLSIANAIKEKYDTKRTLIIGIDGLGGAGKSTISESLSALLGEENYSVTLLHIDDFIHPRSVRYNSDYPEWECYYNLQWRYDYLIDRIIEPIKSGRDFACDIELYDKDNDSYFLQPAAIPNGSIVIIEGIFLQRPELKGVFDYMIYIDVPEETRLARVLERDGYIGGKEQIKAKYDGRYFPAERHYVKSCAPADNADFVIRSQA